MCSVTQKKNILHTLNVFHFQCSVGHEMLFKNMLHVFVEQTDACDDDSRLSQHG